MLGIKGIIHIWIMMALFTTTAAAGAIQSDDFSSPALNSNLWTVINPLGDGSYRMTGTQLALTVPSGPHAILTSGNNSLRVMQAVDNTDFELETKFESSLSAPASKYVIEGVLIQQSSTQFLRFDFESNGNSTKLYVGYFNGSTQTTKIFKTLYTSPTQPLYMRILRSGSTWTVTHSANGSSWTSDGSFTQALTVTQVGPFVSNEGNNVPGFTSLVDYFFNTASPISPEDTKTLTIVTTGSGSVTCNPSLANYPAATTVTLTAVPVSYWGFDHWTRDLTGAKNPGKIFMNDNKTVEAVFTQVITNVSVAANFHDATVSWTTDKTVTSRVDYGLTNSYGGAVNDTSAGLNHAVPLTNLTDGTTYHYRMTCTDANGNTAQTDDRTFTTPAVPIYTLTVNVSGQGSVARVPDQTTYTLGTVVELTATPADGWRFSGWSGALAGSANPASVAMTTDTLVGAAFEELIITVHSVSVTTDTAQVAWTTNFPMTSWISYGTSDQYELGTIQDNSAGTSHAVSLTGLAEGVLYHYRITAVDGSGHTTQTGDRTFKTAGERRYKLSVNITGQGEVERIPDQTAYTSGTVVNLIARQKAGWRFSGWSGALSGNANSASVVMTTDTVVGAAFDELSITIDSVVVTTDTAWIMWTTNYPMTSQFSYGATDVYGTVVNDDSPMGINHAVALTGLTAETSYYYCIAAVDANGNEAPPVERSFMTAARKIFSLDINVTGQGSVARVPNQNLYARGATVRLTATPTAGWRFSGWSGALSGIMNPDSVVMTTNTVVGALFEQMIITVDSVTPTTHSAQIAWTTNFPTTGRISYGLTNAYELGTVNDASTGTSHAVTLSNLAPGTTYHYRITATDAGGTSVQTGDQTFATAVIPVYTLTVNVTGQGSVARAPNQATYPQGTSVTLTATPTAGWRFSGWSGALTGSANPASVTITTNTVVGARFDEFVITPGAVNLTSNSAQISWTTNFPSTGRVEFGLTNSYELGQVSSNQSGLQHTVTITGLDMSRTHHYRIVARDEGGAETATGDRTMVLHTGAIVSDDFSHAALDPAVWTFVNPLGDGSYALNGTQLRISVPQGTNHDIWTDGINAPRVMQAVANGDFGLEVKFESLPTLKYQLQGILVEQDATHHLRFEFHSDGTRFYAYAAYITNTAATVRIQKAITGTNPMWMHVTRLGDDWLMEYSSDGTTWTSAGLFTQAFTMTAIGPYAGNYGAPAFTATVDYFFNDASPIIPEDYSGLTLTTIATGQGTILRTPNKAVYTVGEVVAIEAVPDPSWRFAGWTGDTTGTLNPVSITLAGDCVVTGHFQQFIVDPHAIAAENSAVIRWTTPVPATGSVEYGLTSNYGSTVQSGTLVTTHSLTLPGLSGNTTYHFRIASADAAGSVTRSADMTFTTGIPSTIVSDDFYGTTTKPIWTFVNPTGDASLAMTGTQAQITVAAGAHELWTTGMNAPRLEQAAANTNFEVEAKFESIISEGYHEQGIFVEESESRFIRIELYHDGVAPHFLVVTIQNGAYTAFYDQVIATSMPQYMRVKRVGDAWTAWYKTGTSDWIQAVAFNYVMIVTKVGPYAGTYGPAHTALIDYFFNTDSPITPEDGATYSLTVNVSGNGTVAKNPDRMSYLAGDVVQLTATPNDQATVFTGWSGALTGNQNPAQVTIHGNTSVTANFAPSGNTAINMWYGDSQVFGAIGKPQVWVDLLGTVNDGDGIASLTYSLNGGAQKTLSVGPDGRRLQGAGDFDVQLAYSELMPGLNTIVLYAVDGLSHLTTKTVTVNYIDGVIPDVDMDVNWATVAKVEDIVQPVDGHWASTSAGAKNTSIGYDRLITIGDMGWTDYEITVPITVHSWDPSGVGGINGYPGAGFMLRWNGHTNDPPVATQPLSGWNPFGNVVWYQWNDSGGQSSTFEDGTLKDSSGTILQFNVTYMYKVRIETVPGQGTLYSKKVWRQSDPEPAGWTRQAYGANAVGHGSIMFVAHWTQMTVGNISIRSTVAPFNTISVNARTNQATITWQTTAARTSVVNYGLTTAYELGSRSDSVLTTSHSLTLTGLTPGTLYHYKLSGVNASGASASSDDLTFSTASPQIIRSDNFNTTTLNTAIWTFVDPIADSTLVMSGTEAQISVPARSDHDAWTNGNRTARLMQPTSDSDFQIVAKFNSALTAAYQFHGLIAEQDLTHYLRFDVVKMGSTTNAYCAWMSGTSASTKVNKAIDASAPLYLRVGRAGQTWTYDYSHDGSTWTRIVSFNQAMTATKVGVMVGNAEGTSSPAYTGRIDFFNNTAAPVQN